MPNSSARCAQLPRAVDKVPFYAGLKKYRDYLRGTVSSIEESEMVFKDVKLQNFNDKQPFKRELKEEEMSSMMSSDMNDNSSSEGPQGYGSADTTPTDIRIDPLTGKKKRGRPPKPRPDGTVPVPKRSRVDEHGLPLPRGSNPIDPLTGKKKRGRPKKSDSQGSAAGSTEQEGVKGSNGLSGSKRESVDSTDSYGGSSGEQVQPQSAADVGVDSKTAAAMPPLPPFSPNFCRPSSGMELQHSSSLDNDKGAANIETPSGAIPPQLPPQKEPPTQRALSSSSSSSSAHNVNEMHEYDRAARLQGTTNDITNDVRSHSSHSSGHNSDYHTHPVAATHSNDPTQLPNQQHPDQHHQQQQQHQYNHQQYPYPGYPQISSRSDSSGSLTPTAPTGVPSHHPQQQQQQHYSPGAANGNHTNNAYPSGHNHQHPSLAQSGEPTHTGGGQSFNANQRQHPHMIGQKTGRRADDVATKSITGLESLVDQIPSLETDSGVYSANSGASGSQPETPRSMGPYSPAATAGYHVSSFHNPGFPVPAAAAAASGGSSTANHFSSVPSTSDSSNFTTPSDSTNYSSAGGSGSGAINAQPPTNFSVSSLMHNSGAGGTGGSANPSSATSANEANGPSNASLGGSSSLMPPPPPAPFSTDSFSVSSLTSSYAAAAAQAHDMASKYSAGLANNPYMSSAFGSSAFGAGSFLGQAGIGASAAAANSFMSGSMGGAMGAAHMGAAAMGMGAMGAYYGQYSQAAAANAAYGGAAAAAATQGFAHASPYSHGLHMPNPGYPYSPYGQSPYSQSPYF